MSKTPGTNAFLEAYHRLTPTQKQAVDAIEGPVMVIAGPGTGKTQILTLRIAKILLETDTPPEGILALTFTKSGVSAMRERLRQFMGSAAYRVNIHTFHGLAERLIREYPDAYPKIVGARAATDLDRIRLMERILETPGLGKLRPVNAPAYYINPLLSTISEMKQENVLPDDLARIITEESRQLETLPRYHEKGAHKGKERSEYKKLVEIIEKQTLLLTVYRQYEAGQRNLSLYDYDDMILETVRVLRENESVLRDVQERYLYVLADEHQDVNGAQNEILFQIAAFHEEPNLFVVGDEKQAIYRFQGASLENFVSFTERFPHTRVINLTDNFRSTQPILDTVHNLIKVEDGPLLPYRVPLFAKLTRDTDITVTAHETTDNENTALVSSITALRDKGSNLKDIAVIVRSNRDVRYFRDLLIRNGLRATASSDYSVLEHPVAKQFLTLLRAAAYPEDNQALTEVFLGSYWGISIEDTLLVLKEKSYAVPLLSLLRNETALKEIGVKNVPAVLAVTATLDSARASTAASLSETVKALLVQSGFLATILAEHSIENAAVVRCLHDEIVALTEGGIASTLREVLAVFNDRILHQLPLLVPLSGYGEDAISVMTAHKAKGLEYLHVYIPRVTERSWGKSSRPDHFKLPLVKRAELAREALEDERRLLYVAMSRAKCTLHLSYARMNEEGGLESPAGFLDDLGLPITEANSAPETVPSVLGPLLLPAVAPPPLLDLLRSQLVTEGFSATSLNCLLENPWNYFFECVLRVPSIDTSATKYGTAMHAAVEYATAEWSKTGSLPKFSAIRAVLEKRLQRVVVDAVEFTELFERGLAALAVYLPHLEATLPTSIKTELKTNARLSLPKLKGLEIPLRGTLDRVDFDENGYAIRVVDYKTGKPKSRNELEGKTAKGALGYKRQLAFYALLLDLREEERYHTDCCVLSFIEPTNTGKIKEESFITGPEEMKGLLEDIERAIELLETGEFLKDEELLKDSSYEAIGYDLIRRLR